MQQSKRIAILGLGAMGLRMAQRLIDEGHQVTGFNRTPQRAQALTDLGARFASTPRDAVEGCDIAISCVRDDEATHAVWLDHETGAMAAMPAHAIAIDTSTVTPTCAGALATRAAGRALAWLSAPVVGSRPQAESGQLVMLVGGNAEVLDRARNVLAPLASAIHHVGSHDAAARLKLLVNTLFAVQVATVAELLGIARDSKDLDVAHVKDILTSLSVTSPAAAVAMNAMLAGAFDPLFPIALVAKDLAYAREMATQRGSDAPTTTAAANIYQHAVDEGLGALNITGIARRYGF